MKSQRDLPIVCTLQPGELNARASELLPGVVAAAKARHAIENGFQFEFHPDSEVLTSIVRMIDAERQCCQFLRFQLRTRAPKLVVHFGVCLLVWTGLRVRLFAGRVPHPHTTD